jgi:hypothetical protein
MPVSYQLVIDCHDPRLLSHFWAAALGYVIAPPPDGFGTWDDYWRDLGVPESDLGIGDDRIVDPQGEGPAIWFQIVPDTKSVKNRLHVDVRASGARTVPLAERRAHVEAMVERLTGLGASRLRSLFEEGFDHYAVAMTDPEGNEFDVN